MICAPILHLSSITATLTHCPNPLLHAFRYTRANNVGKPNGGRRRFAPNATSLELPLLPFNTTNEVLIPSESKSLYLYEARYLALLEESLLRKKKLFVHFVLDPILISNSGTEASFAARHGCLVTIEHTIFNLNLHSVFGRDVGALVSIRRIGRVKIVRFVQLQSNPYLKGEVIPWQDRDLCDASPLNSKVKAVVEALHSLNRLEIKLKAPKEELLQTGIANSLEWAEKDPSVQCDVSFIPSLAERISFAAFQPISRSTQSEMFKLQQQKLRAMDAKDTFQRLDDSLKLINENISLIAAKLEIQSIG
ncbi:hypothetical protein K2173_007074 [Erythroxylum novogranatense]|uniref:Lon N-terminal domain-containing protein n=1 Tax=Erythroxylum novogranatense TaxID=1862640 RepID=A0AAV8SYS3_9ROSI|nr:hypothetical protein K2173_007074 [Erythroxylum novogranatense]